MRFVAQTRFDITATGVTGHYKSAKVPFQDRAGNNIVDQESWNRARNQQRNWETLIQLLSMRTQIFNLEEPTKSQDIWSFEFETETPDVFGPPENPVAVLLSDADGIPMINHLDNPTELPPVLTVSGPAKNIWFMPISINN
jgi:hypothetical protein